MTFEAQATQIKDRWIVKLPSEVSRTLPSRGMGMADIRIDKWDGTLPLEPDGRGGHWFELPSEIKKTLGSTSPFSVQLEQTLLWPEPELAEETKNLLRQEGLADYWSGLTVKARWEWIRWLNSTKSEETQKKRRQVMLSKLKKGDRRPCCFNTASCTVADLAKSGILLEVGGNS